MTARRAIEEKTDDVKKPKLEKNVKVESDEDEEEMVKVKGKRKIACIIDSDSDYENEENESDNSQDDSQSARKKKSDGGNAVAKKKLKLESNGAKLSFEAKLKVNLDESRSLFDVKENDTTDIIDVPTVYAHQEYDFLKPTNIRDAEKRRPNHPDYDPTTLYVPEKHLNDLTPVSI